MSEAVDDSLGKLERRVLAEVRRGREVSVRQVWQTIGGPIAYTTVKTTMDRLYRKGLLDRRSVGRPFVYSEKLSVEEMERGVVEDVIVNLLESSSQPVEPILACIVDAVSESDRQLLDDLERLVREKRAKLEGKDK